VSIRGKNSPKTLRFVSGLTIMIFLCDQTRRMLILQHAGILVALTIPKHLVVALFRLACVTDLPAGSPNHSVLVNYLFWSTEVGNREARYYGRVSSAVSREYKSL
jgi:hypothetical protein